jgi:hypothetical protein
MTFTSRARRTLVAVDVEAEVDADGLHLAAARKPSGWPKRRKLAHADRWEDS